MERTTSIDFAIGRVIMGEKMELKSLTVISAVISIIGIMSAYAGTVDSVKLDVVSDKTTSISIGFSEPLEGEPKSFLTQTPPRLSVDLQGIFETSENFHISDGLVKDFQLVATGDRSRLIFDLTEMVSHSLTYTETKVLIKLTRSTIGPNDSQSVRKIENIDIDRVQTGKARITVNLSEPDIPINISTSENEIIINFVGVSLPKQLERKLKIAELETPAKTVETSSNENLSLIHI